MIVGKQGYNSQNINNPSKDRFHPQGKESHKKISLAMTREIAERESLKENATIRVI